MPDVFIRRLDADVSIPTYANPGDAGVDLASSVDVVIAPTERVLVPTGIAIALPPDFVAFVQPRSGLAYRTGLSIVNTPGTIDSGYRGEIKVLLINHDHDREISIRRGDRIAQLVVQRVEQVQFVETDSLDETVRGSGGYGSSGVHSQAGGQQATPVKSDQPEGDV